MRRNNFLVGAFAALITYVLLSMFVPHPWRGHHRWHHHDHYEDQIDNRKDGVRMGMNSSGAIQLFSAIGHFFDQAAAR